MVKINNWTNHRENRPFKGDQRYAEEHFQGRGQDPAEQVIKALNKLTGLKFESLSKAKDTWTFDASKLNEDGEEEKLENLKNIVGDDSIMAFPDQVVLTLDQESRDAVIKAARAIQNPVRISQK